MAMTTQDQDDIIAGINVTPLVDIVLVILIIFIMTASVIFRSSLPLSLPQAASAEKTPVGLLNLGITASGALYVNGQPRRLDELPAAVADARRRAGTRGEKVSAFVSADVKAPYGLFAQVVDRLRLEQVEDIALDTQPTAVAEPSK